MSNRHIAVIIVAGGSGTRMGGTLPKQFLTVGGKPVLMHTLGRFAEVLAGVRLILVLPRNHIGYWDELCREYDFRVAHTVCSGGATRFESVRAGLDEVGDADLVAVHDGVRPLLNSALIERVVADARTFGAVVPVVMPTDSLREIADGGSRIVDRSRYRIVQTPQAFHADVILSAYRNATPGGAFTDDASVVEASGRPVYLCEGDYTNVKLTTPADLIIAEALLNDSSRQLLTDE